VIHVIAETTAKGENMIATAEETTEPKAKKGARRSAQSANLAPKKAKSEKATTSAHRAFKRAKTTEGAHSWFQYHQARPNSTGGPSVIRTAHS
jgi:hypothetical protein